MHIKQRQIRSKDNSVASRLSTVPSPHHMPYLSLLLITAYRTQNRKTQFLNPK